MPIMLLLLLLWILMKDEVHVGFAGNSIIPWHDEDKQRLSFFSLLLLQLINRADDDVNVTVGGD